MRLFESEYDAICQYLLGRFQIRQRFNSKHFALYLKGKGGGREFGFECFCIFLFCFCLVCGEKVASAQDFVGNQRERTIVGRGFLFLVHLVKILYCSVIVWSKDLFAYFFCFLSIFDRELCFLFFAFSHSLIGNFSLFFLLFSEGKD